MSDSVSSSAPTPASGQIAPAVLRSELSVLQLVRSPKLLRLFVRLLLVLFSGAILALIIVPWQQNMPRQRAASSAFEPVRSDADHRRSGRWAAFARSPGSSKERPFPNAATRLLEIVDNDPSIVEPARTSRRASLDGRRSKRPTRKGIACTPMQAYARLKRRESSPSRVGRAACVEVADGEVFDLKRHGVGSRRTQQLRTGLASTSTRQRDLYSRGSRFDGLEFEVADRVSQAPKPIAESGTKAPSRRSPEPRSNEVQAKQADLGRAGIQTEGQAQSIDSARADSEERQRPKSRTSKNPLIANSTFEDQLSRHTQLLRAPRDGNRVRGCS